MKMGTIIGDWKVGPLIHSGQRSNIFHGTSMRDNTPVVLKIPVNPTDQEAALRIRSEHAMLLSMHSARIVQTLGLATDGEQTALVLSTGQLGTDPGECKSIKEWLQQGLFKENSITSLEERIQLAQSIVRGLADIHAADLIHKDICPQNILYKPEKKSILIFDFSISSRSPGFNTAWAEASNMEGTLTCLSPEQSGILNRSIDWRSDYYSLGATLYELFTGQPPFTETDRLSLIHSHISRTPAQPRELNPKVPQALSDIIMKLLRKDPESRYRSSSGILHDLNQSLKLLKESEANPDSLTQEISLGTHDISNRFSFPDALYGRDEEIERLLQSYKESQKESTRIVIIKGKSGTGKTSLAYELFRSPETIGMLFARGRYEKLTRGVPFSGLLMATRNIIQMIQSSQEDQRQKWIAHWKDRIKTSGPMLASLVPEITSIIGEQEPLPELQPQETQNLLYNAFLDLISAASSMQRPLVILLDDIQWADQGTIELLQEVTKPLSEQKGILFISTCRTEELSADNPVNMAIEKLTQENSIISEILLKPIQREDAINIINTTYPMEPQTSQEFGSAIWNISGGNPFFLRQLLETLYTQYQNARSQSHPQNSPVITFDTIEGLWQWDQEALSKLAQGANVQYFLERKVNDLPASCQETLNAASCIGRKFSFGNLSALLERDAYSIIRDIQYAVTAGILRPRGMSYRVVTELSNELSSYLQNKAAGSCRELYFSFVHDQIMDHLQSRTPEMEKSLWHYRIAMQQYQANKITASEEQIFSIAGHLNNGKHHIIQDGKAELLIDLNAEACRLSKSAIAYSSAYSYFCEAKPLIRHQHWENNYQNILNFHINGLETAGLSGHHDEAELLFFELDRMISKTLDKARIYSVMIQLYTNINRMEDGITLAARALHLLNCPLPLEPEEIGQEIENQNAIIAEYRNNSDSIESFANLPAMKDTIALAAHEILLNVSVTAYMSDPNLYIFIVLKMVTLSLQEGNSPVSAFSYVNYALVLASAFGDPEGGYRFGNVALKLLQNYSTFSLFSKVNHIFAAGINHWKNHVRSSIQYFDKAYTSGVQYGDILYAGYASNQKIISLLAAGEKLETVKNEHKQYQEFIHRHKDPVINKAFALQLQFIRSLQGEIEGSCELFDSMFKQEDLDSEKSIILNSNYHVLHLQLCSIHHNLQKALAAIDASTAEIMGSFGSIHTAEHYFHSALLLFAILREGSAQDAQARKKQAESYISQMAIWAESGPENYKNRLLLMQAEQAFTEKQDAGALYEQAIDEAHKQDFTQNYALANELAGRYQLQQGETQRAASYIKTAIDSWNQWGAQRKAKSLFQEFRELLDIASSIN